MKKFDPGAANAAVEGRIDYDLVEIREIIKEVQQPNFVRMIVLEVISDPLIIDNDKIDYWENVLGVSNIRFAKILPRNSIIAQKTLKGLGGVSLPMFLFPFFPSHLSLPCKPGEMVWAMFENPNAKIKEMAYWMCRISEPNIIDDVNHTHHPAQFDPSLSLDEEGSTEARYSENDKPVYELRNGKVLVSKEDKTRFLLDKSRVLPSDDEEVFEKLLKDTDAAKMMQYESIPRYKKRPGDVVLEGTNNTLISLGTDRSGPIAFFNFGNPDDDGRAITPKPTNDLTGSAGAIDIVAGRGMEYTTGGIPAKTQRILDGTTLKNEIGKTYKEISLYEGDPDFLNDRSRILVSQRTKVDNKFGVEGYLKSSLGIEDAKDGDSAIVIKSDKIRIIARSDLSLIVTNYTTTGSLSEGSNNGLDFKKENSLLSDWASITIKTNGDIVFSPSTSGVVKLGGDDADRAILCTSKPATRDDGTVQSPPIATTAGGFVGSAGGNIDIAAKAGDVKPDLGTFSSKVLVTANVKA